MKNVYDGLIKDARYALNSINRDLVYQTYGAASMAYELGAITKEQFYDLNDMLIRDGLNDPSGWRRRAKEATERCRG